MGIRLTTDADLTSVANAIRTKGGTNASLSYPAGFINAIGAISSALASAPKKDVNFIDYDGTILYSYSAAEFANLSALPANPSHSGLTAQGWNWSLADAKTYVASYGKLWIGQMYVTDDGKTRLYIHIEDIDNTLYELSWRQSVAYGVTINWGDGSAEETFDGVANIGTSHQYTTIGDFVITLNPTSGTVMIGGSGTYTNLFGYYSYKNIRPLSASLQKVEMGNNAGFRDYAFSRCYNLANITMPNNLVTELKPHLFHDCYSLSSITIPSGITEIQEYCIYECSSLTRISIPNTITTIQNSSLRDCNSLYNIIISSSITSIGDYCFIGNNSLKNITIPNSITTIPEAFIQDSSCLTSITLPSSITQIKSSAFRYCYSLTKFTIPINVTTIGAYAFGECAAIREYHLLPTAPPTLANTNAFSKVSTGYVIYVPYSADHSILNAYKTASNWATYADYMQEEPQS